MLGLISGSRGVASLGTARLSASVVAEDADIGTVIGTLIDTRDGSTLVLTGDASGALGLDGVDIVTADALDYEMAATLAWEVTETRAGSLYSPKVHSGTITVTNVLEVVLVDLSLDNDTLSETATGTVGAIVGGTASSTITLSAQSNATWFAKSGGNIVTGAGTLDETVNDTPTITLKETHADAADRYTVIPITVSADLTPAAFTFTDQTDVEADTVIESDEVTVSGLGPSQSVAVTVTGGQYAKNGGAYTAVAGTAVNGSTFTVRHTSSALPLTDTDTVLTIGGVSDTFTSTTAAV